MAPILYHHEISPPVRAVLLTAKAIGLNLELRDIQFLEGEQMKPEFVKMNPQHTIPTLDDNGFILGDSHAICAYLVGKYAKNDSLYPKDLQKRAVVDQRLHFDSWILFPRLKNICFPILILGKTALTEAQKEAMLEGYALTDAFLERSDYFAGDHLTIADFCAVASISSMVPVVPFDPKKLSHLARWMAKMKALPYYEEMNGKGADGIAALVNKGLGM